MKNLAIIFILISASFFLFSLTDINQKITTTPVDISSDRIKEIYKEQYKNLPKHDLVCIPEKKFSCSDNGCIDKKPDVFNLVQRTERSINLLRCDSKPCDSYPVEFIHNSGDIWSLQPLEYKALLFRSSFSDNKYTEITTLGTISFISIGFCYDSV